MRKPSLVLAVSLVLVVLYACTGARSDAEIAAEAAYAQALDAARVAAQKEQAEERKSVGQDIANLIPLGENIQDNGLVPQGKGVVAVGEHIAATLRLTPAEIGLATVPKAKWEQAEAALSALRKEQVANDAALVAVRQDLKAATERADQYAKVLDEEKKKNTGILAWARDSVAVAGTIGALTAVLSMFNGPVGNLASSLGRILCPGGFRRLEGKVTAAETQVTKVVADNSIAIHAVMASDVGAKALGLLDKAMAKNPQAAEVLATAISGITGEKMSIKDLFKTFAKETAEDCDMQPAIDTLLQTVRNTPEFDTNAQFLVIAKEMAAARSLA